MDGDRVKLPISEAGSWEDGDRLKLHISDAKFGFKEGSGMCVRTRIPSGILNFWTVSTRLSGNRPSVDFF